MSDTRPWRVTETDSPHGHAIHGRHGSRGRDEAPHIGNVYRLEDAERIVAAVNAMSTPERTPERRSGECGAPFVYDPDGPWGARSTYCNRPVNHTGPHRRDESSDRRTPVDVAPEGTAKCSKGASLTGWDYDYHRQHGCVEAMGAPEGTEREAIAKTLSEIHADEMLGGRPWTVERMAAAIHADLAALRARPPQTEARMFPVQDGPDIPWSEAEVAYKAYADRFGTQQSLERIAERGGFYVDELRKLLPQTEASEPVAASEPIQMAIDLIERDDLISFTDTLTMRSLLHHALKLITTSPPAPSSSPEDVAWMDLAKDYEDRLTAMTRWLEENKPEVFREGLWDALATTPEETTE